MTVRGDRERYPYHRKFVRHRIRVKIDVLDGRSYSSWTINISEGGLCFEIPLQVEVGSEIGVWIYLSRDRRASPIRAAARVVWNQGRGDKHRHGAQLTDFEERGREALQRWLRGQ